MKIFSLRCAEIGESFLFLFNVVLTQCHEFMLSAIRGLQLREKCLICLGWKPKQNQEHV